jgi:hypothetical protein
MVGFSDVVGCERNSTQIPKASVSPWPSSATTKVVALHRSHLDPRV